MKYKIINVYKHDDPIEREEALRENLLRAGRGLQWIRRKEEREEIKRLVEEERNKK